MSCRDSVEDFVHRHGVRRHLRSFPIEVRTVELASEATGSPPSGIVKTIVVRYDEGFAVVVALGDRRIPLSEVVKVLNSRSIRLARADEVRDVVGFDVGEVSPLSECVRRLRVVDRRDLEREVVWCGGGSANTLARAYVEDLVRVLNPLVADVS